jgi:hypothetical protein
VKDIFFYAIRTGGGRDWRHGKTAACQQRSDDHLTPERCVYHCLTPGVFPRLSLVDNS